MTTSELRRAVARATGESLKEIRERGFGLADPCELDFDSEGYDQPPSIVDWDHLDRRRFSLFP